jgi:hypothetical protein
LFSLAQSAFAVSMQQQLLQAAKGQQQQQKA